MMHKFLKLGAWKDQEPWSTRYAPGGDRYAHLHQCVWRTPLIFRSEHIMEFIAVWMAKGYHWFNQVPRFIFLMATGGITSLLLGLLHRGDKKPKPKPVKRANLHAVPAVIIDPKEATQAPVAASTSTPSTPKKRKGGKK